jgi:hypothetical protein
MAQVNSAGSAHALTLPRFCGTAVEAEEWEVLHEIVDTCGVSRTELASTICEALGWVRSNGRLKTRECYEYLSLLEEKGLLQGLPAKREQRPRGVTSIHYTAASELRAERRGELAEVKPVSLSLVSGAEQRALWRELVERHHYLGHKVAYGAHLRYLVWMSAPQRELCGCLQFSSAARRVAARDRWIGWDDATRQRGLTQVVNNSRFLILPWLHIRDLASHVLSLASRVVVEDWQEAYGVRPVLLETFVTREIYEGTCYRAANWVEVGATAGRGRMDREKRWAEPVKTCLVYPLVGDFRRRLGAAR